MENMKIRVNPLPAPTWRWLRINDTEIQLPDEVTESLVETSVPEVKTGTFDEREFEILQNVETGMGGAFKDFTSAAPVDPFLFKIAEGEKAKEPLSFRIYLTGTESTVNRFYFSAPENSEYTVVMYLTAEEAAVEASGLSATLDARFFVGQGAKLRLVQVFDQPQQMSAYSDVGAHVEKAGSFEVLQIALKGAKTFLGVAADLAETEAHLGIETAYQAEAGQHVDLNYVARHRGKKTTTDMEVKGVLWEGASKSCRATVDFIRGCKESKGVEREDVLLLGENVVNKTIPLILCQEEDVEGEHGATIGDLSDEILWYFRSRGIDDETAYQLMARGRLLGSIRKIPEDKLRRELLERLQESEADTAEEA